MLVKHFCSYSARTFANMIENSFLSVAKMYKQFLGPLHIDRIWVMSWRCWFTRVKGGFSQEMCNLVNSGCWMSALRLLPNIPLSSSAAGNLTTRRASPGKWRQITWDFWTASLIMTINRMLMFYISPHKTKLLMVSCGMYLADVMHDYED